MKKLLSNMIAILAILSVVLVGCKKPQENEPETPHKAVIEGAAQNDCPEVVVTLTASATHAKSFEWRRYNSASGGTPTIISGQTGASLEWTVVANVWIAVVGINDDGRGPESDRHAITFVPCVYPEKATLIANREEACIDQNVQFTATSTFATSFQWEVDGAIVQNHTATTFNINLDAAGIRVVRVRGVNEVGEGPFSDPITMEWVACDEQVTVVGDWDVTALRQELAQGEVAPINDPQAWSHYGLVLDAMVVEDWDLAVAPSDDSYVFIGWRGRDPETQYGSFWIVSVDAEGWYMETVIDQTDIYTFTERQRICFRAHHDNGLWCYNPDGEIPFDVSECGNFVTFIDVFDAGAPQGESTMYYGIQAINAQGASAGWFSLTSNVLMVLDTKKGTPVNVDRSSINWVRPTRKNTATLERMPEPVFINSQR